jgi:hypothetical protein
MVGKLLDRGAQHDRSKMEEPELSIFNKCTERLRGMTYGSPDYLAALGDMKPALEHHYASNRHHPEHYPQGIRGMNLVDLMELFCDWAAACRRHADGDLRKSIEINQKRFNMGDELTQILRNTVEVLEKEWT